MQTFGYLASMLPIIKELYPDKKQQQENSELQINKYVATILYNNKELIVEMYDKILKEYTKKFPNKIKVLKKNWCIPTTYTLSDHEEIKKDMLNTDIFPYEEIYGHKTNTLEQKMSKYLDENNRIKL